jgi:hypothetical protein
LDAGLTILLRKRITAARFIEVKPGWSNSNLAGFSKERYGSKWTVLPMMMMSYIVYQ